MAMEPIDPDIEQYVDSVVATLQRSLGSDLVGVYLHGSLAMDAFDLGRSDVDIVAVCADALPKERRAGLGEDLDALPRPKVGVDLEFSLVTRAAISPPSAAPSFEVHVSTHEDAPVVDGHDRPGDEDLVMHFAMCRARGRALYGPEPADLFPATDRWLLLGGFLSDLRSVRDAGAAWWEGHHMPEFASAAYRVLNAARSWRYLETGQLGSKIEGAEWVRSNDPRAGDRALIDASVAFQHGEPATMPAREDVEDFVGRVEALLQAELDEAPPGLVPPGQAGGGGRG